VVINGITKYRAGRTTRPSKPDKYKTRKLPRTKDAVEIYGRSRYTETLFLMREEEAREGDDFALSG